MAFCCSLAMTVLAWITSSRSTGSSRSVASEVNIIDTWLPWVPCWSSVRTDTGTMATSGPSGCSSRWSK